MESQNNLFRLRLRGMYYPSVKYNYMISKYIFESEIIHPKIQLLAFFNMKYFENDEMASNESIITKLSLLLFYLIIQVSCIITH